MGLRPEKFMRSLCLGTCANAQWVSPLPWRPTMLAQSTWLMPRGGSCTSCSLSCAVLWRRKENAKALPSSSQFVLSEAFRCNWVAKLVQLGKHFCFLCVAALYLSRVISRYIISTLNHVITYTLQPRVKHVIPNVHIALNKSIP